MSIKILIADDEVLARKRIHSLLDDSELDCLIDQAASGKESLQKIEEYRPDIVFLDIQMSDMTGFEVLAKLEREVLPIIIFVTAFDDFAIKAFEFQALDFILKPYKNDRFYEALNRAVTAVSPSDNKQYISKISQLMELLDNAHVSVGSTVSYLERVVIKLGKKYYFVPTDTIKYISSSSYYAEIFTLDNAKHTYRISMSEFMSKLNPAMFARISRSTIVNVLHVKEVVSEGQGDYSIVMRDGRAFSLTNKYRESFLSLLNIK